MLTSPSLFALPITSKLQVVAATTPLHLSSCGSKENVLRTTTMTKRQSVDSRYRFLFFSVLCKYHFTSLFKEDSLPSTFLQTDSYGNFKYGNLSIYLSTCLFRSIWKFLTYLLKIYLFLFKMPTHWLSVYKQLQFRVRFL